MTMWHSPLRKSILPGANVNFLMCHIHGSTWEAQESTGGYVLAFQQSSMLWGESINWPPAWGVCPSWHLLRSDLVWRVTFVSVTHVHVYQRSLAKSLHITGSRSMFKVLMSDQLRLPCSFFFVALCVCLINHSLSYESRDHVCFTPHCIICPQTALGL